RKIPHSAMVRRGLTPGGAGGYVWQVRGRMLLGLLAIGTIVVGILAVGPASATRQSRAGTRSSVKVKFPLPPPNTGQVSFVTVKAIAPKGEKVGAVSAKTTNDAELRTINPSAVYIVQTPKKRSRRETI